jgi:deoxyribonuclease-4
LTNTVKFGSAGNPESFYAQGGKSSLEMPKWLAGMGLDAYEYQCTRGVKISAESAEKLGALARENSIDLSVHSPYYINISGTDPEKLENSINHIMQTARAAANMGASRVVVHMGSAMGMTRRDAMDISKRTIHRVLAQMDGENLGDVHICPETMGKINQMGTIEEVLELCALDERLIPTIDFGHLNSRGMGNLTRPEDFEHIIDMIYKSLGSWRAANFHCHFSKIEYTKGGERKHLTFEDEKYGPQFEPLAAVIIKHSLTPVIICESAGTQAEDAVIMKNILKSYSDKGERK